MSEMLSNVIGAPFPEHVLKQLELRAIHNSTGYGSNPTRTNDEILFLANKSAWVKLTSSIRIQLPPEKLTAYYRALQLNIADYKNEDSLAKNWILEAGTSVGDGPGINLRKGIGPDGAYGLGGTQELGYRPMPGLSTVSIDTKGTLGSLREANISFKVWNMNQLNVIEALYFRLGYSMLLEWGHTQYYSNVNREGTAGGSFTTNAYGINPFEIQRKEQVQQNIAKRAYLTSGNYDGMLGIVTNFNWSFNQDGGYDCTLKLMGLGAIIDSLKINLSYKMPSILYQRYKTQNERLQEEQEAAAKREADQRAKQDAINARIAQGLPATPPPTPKNGSDIYNNIYLPNIGNPRTPPETESTFLNRHSIYPSYIFANDEAASTVPDYYYKAYSGNQPVNYVNELNNSKTGLFLNANQSRTNWQLIPADVSVGSPQPVTLSRYLVEAIINRGRISGEAIREVDAYQNIFIPLVSKGTSTKIYPPVSGDEVPGLATAFGKKFSILLKNQLKTFGNTFGFGESPDNRRVNVQVNFIIPYYGTTYTTNGTLSKKLYFLAIGYMPISSDENNKNLPTVQELAKAVDDWWNSSNAEISLTSLSWQNLSFNNGFSDVVLTGKLKGITIPGKTVAPNITIAFNNTICIDKVLERTPPQTPQTTPAQPAAAGDTNGATNDATSVQTDSADTFASSLHAMLAAVKSEIQANTPQDPNKGVFTVPLTKLTNAFFQDGILTDLLNVSGSIPTANQPFDLKKYAKKGFNSNLMLDPAAFNQIPDVNFTDLCTGYGIRYTVKEDTNKFNFPTYIKFGYLMAFLNNMCLIYDSTQDTNKHPYVYLDFNPETNLCLTNPQHLSVDPFTCMIPFQGTLQDYQSIFLKNNTIDKKSIDALGADSFRPELNAVSSYIQFFKAPDNSYQGKTMNILLNIDFLTTVLNQNTTNNPTHTVNLKGFLDAIVTGINKSTGNINLFRVAYRDDSNTVVIKDDQFVPPLPNEKTGLYVVDPNNTASGASGGRNTPRYGQLPVFGAQSLVREMQFQTDLSTKISNQLAISGQAETGSVNSTDHSAFSYLNVNYVDAYKPKITNSATTTAASTQKQQQLQQQEKDTIQADDFKQAVQFNAHVKSVYYGGTPLSKDVVSPAINYYNDSMASIKATDTVTTAAPFIPANLQITIDGISGIVMGNAFTIPENRLPLTLRGEGTKPKVAFIVVGLTHEISENQWLTKIRGQMIKLRNESKYVAPNASPIIETAFSSEISPIPAAESTPGGGAVITSAGCKTSYPELAITTTIQPDYIKITDAAKYLKSKYPDVGLATFALLLQEAAKSGDSFRSAGGNNFGGVQTDAGKWGFSNFSGQFCRRDSANALRMFAMFKTPYEFLDFLANRVKKKGFTSDPNQWTRTYIDKWWSPKEAASYVQGTSQYKEKLSIFNSAVTKYNQA